MHQEISSTTIESAKTDEQAFIELYQHYGQGVFRFLAARSGNVQLAEDLTQETFITVLKKLPTYTNTGAKFSSWLLQIALNHLRMHWRKRSNAETIDLDTITELFPATNNQSPNYQADWLDFYRALHKLSDDDQTILVMKYVEDMSNQDIADALEITANACGVQIHRALKQLQQYL